MDVLKNDIGEVDEAMIQGVKRPRDSFFVSWASKKSTTTKMLKWCFK
jgi:hypothetical protein